ncbi:sulfurtransferase [Mycobacterium sp. 1164966.3]|uniref:rhodanese-like domain-containing protein n=1 Tax=Mycobacterium sp. 1164966.3 TaxID=1856861 RepID=UPI0007FE2410|nr:rhodanese-like domain-containing protein [Mycobacterium sp. 1164966.3]OBA79676.1 sulfurtransferase [Mycobacterium sp. 1164966.3]
MNAAIATITPTQLRRLLASPDPPRVVDVRTPAEFETTHITGSVNVPLDVLDKHSGEIAEYLDEEHEVVVVCRSGQRSATAAQHLRSAGLTGGRVLEHGLTEWESQGFEVERGAQRWELERQVRLAAGSIVLSSVVASVVIPQLKWVAAAVGGGLTYAAISNTCAMATALSKLPYNRGATSDARTVLSRLGGPPTAEKVS